MKRHTALRSIALAVLVCAVVALPAYSPAQTHAQPVKKTYTIGGIVFGTDVFFQLVRIGMQAAATKAGDKLLLNNSTYDASKEATLVQQYVTAKVDAIVISPVSPKTSSHNLQPATQAGIPISCYNTCINGVTAFVHSSDYDLGHQTGILAAKWIKAHSGVTNIGILTCDKLYQACVNRRKGFFDQLKGLNYKLVAEQQSFLASDAVNVGGTMLQGHPEINLLWAENEGGTVGEVRAVKTAGLAGKVVVFGTDASVQLAQYVVASDNILQATTGQDAYNIGYLAFNQAIALINHTTKGKDITTKSIVLQRSQPSVVQAFIVQNKKWGAS